MLRTEPAAELFERAPLWWTSRKGLFSSEFRQCSREKSSRFIRERRCPPPEGARVETVSEIAKELGVSPSMPHRWREQFEPELSGTTPVSQGEHEEVEQPHRELRDLQAENSL